MSTVGDVILTVFAFYGAVHLGRDLVRAAESFRSHSQKWAVQCLYWMHVNGPIKEKK